MVARRQINSIQPASIKAQGCSAVAGCVAALAAALVPTASPAAEPPPPAVAVRPGPPAVPQPVLAHWRHVCGEARMIESYHARAGKPFTVESVTAGGQAEIWLMPCRSGAYAMTWLLVWQHDGLVDALTEPYRHNSIEPKPRLLSAPAFALVGNGLAVVERRGEDATVADCVRLWCWTGRGFREQSCTATPRPAPVGGSLIRGISSGAVEPDSLCASAPDSDPETGGTMR